MVKEQWDALDLGCLLNLNFMEKLARVGLQTVEGWNTLYSHVANVDATETLKTNKPPLTARDQGQQRVKSPCVGRLAICTVESRQKVYKKLQEPSSWAS